MAIFLKASLWVEKKLGYKGELNLTQLIQSLVNPSSLPYKTYVAVISQSGTNAPTVDYVLENTLGETITYSYDSVGLYSINSPSGIFTAAKTTVTISIGERSPGGLVFGAYREDDNTLKMFSNTGTGNIIDSRIIKATLEIRVYN